MSMVRSVLAVLAVVAATHPASANDKWETSLSFYDDDSIGTPNQLIHGARQTHDLQGTSSGGVPTDRDFSYVTSRVNHSYEVRVFSTQTCFQETSAADCATLARVDSDGTTILQPAIAPDPIGYNPGRGNMALRWIAAVSQSDLIRVNGYVGGLTCDANNQYDIQMRETTYLIPRWNNSGTQTTSFLVQNGTDATVTGSIFFYNAAGVLVSVRPLTLPPNGLLNLATATIPALAGLAGSAAIAHDGPYGALSGKAVALEPATGFTFDTLIQPISY